MIVVGYTGLSKINFTFFLIFKNVAARKLTTTHVAACWTVLPPSLSAWVRIQAQPLARQPALGGVLTPLCLSPLIRKEEVRTGTTAYNPLWRLNEFAG